MHVRIYYDYFKSTKESNYNWFVDMNLLGAARLVHLNLQIYYKILFFRLCVILNTFGKFWTHTQENQYDIII